MPLSLLYAGIHFDISWAKQVGLFLLLCYISIGVQFGPIDDDDIVCLTRKSTISKIESFQFYRNKYLA